MTALAGCKCDGCGDAVLMDDPTGFASEEFPPRGWFTVLLNEEDGGVRASEVAHACSAVCLGAVSAAVRGV